MSTPLPAAPTMLPGIDKLNRDYWRGGAEKKLKIAHCAQCRRYVHPPIPVCPQCDDDMLPVAVSGKGRVASFSVNYQPWLPNMQTPFVFAAIELDEQPELYVFSNIVGVPAGQVAIGLRVRVVFTPVEDIHFPLFEADPCQR